MMHAEASPTAPTLTPTAELRERAAVSLRACGVEPLSADASAPAAASPITGEPLLPYPRASYQEVETAIATAEAAFATWRLTPAPRRGALVKRLSSLLAEHQEALATLITLEVGKIHSEAAGEVQEMVDVCDLAVGISRQLEGRTMPSERYGHRLMESWHPLGVVGVITAFNFPAAVWSWNVALALVCGDTVVWKASPQAPLTAAACSALLDRAAAECEAPPGLNTLVVADAAASEALVDSPSVPLVSATGSERMGAEVAPRIAARFGRALLELGGNNAAIVTPSADLDQATKAIVFAAAGTAGQRCTTMRRVIAHESVAGELRERLSTAMRSLPIGDPCDPGTLVGPLIGGGAYDSMQEALARAEAEGGELLVGGGRREAEGFADAYYVEPAVVAMPSQTELVRTETFAPLLYLLSYDSLAEAIALNNGVPQGLSSCIFTTDQAEAERFLAADGSDCGLANVNLGTSGAEIGGAFGGEKTTGGGRESGSDSWRAYMRRTTSGINFSGGSELAQGVDFG